MFQDGTMLTEMHNFVFKCTDFCSVHGNLLQNQVHNLFCPMKMQISQKLVIYFKRMNNTAEEVVFRPSTDTHCTPDLSCLLHGLWPENTSSKPAESGKGEGSGLDWIQGNCSKDCSKYNTNMLPQGHKATGRSRQ